MKTRPAKRVLACALATLFLSSLAISPTADATPTQDAALFEAMRQFGIELNARAVPAAYQVCAEATSGTTAKAVEQAIGEGNPSWTLKQIDAFILASLEVYCPPNKNA